MKSQKTINLPEKTSDNKDLLKKRTNKKKNYSNNKEIKTEKPIISFSIKLWFYCVKMEFQKIINLLGTTSDNKDLPIFVNKKWIEIYDQSEKNYRPNKEIWIKTSMIRSDLCDFSDAYIVVKGTITAEGDNNANKRNKNLACKNNAPFIKCISKINCIKINNTEDLDVVMPMYNLLK